MRMWVKDVICGPQCNHDFSSENQDRTYSGGVLDGIDYPISGMRYSDTTVAHTVRMLMRDDLPFEPIITMARDRILCLTSEKNALEAANKTMRD